MTETESTTQAIPDPPPMVMSGSDGEQPAYGGEARFFAWCRGLGIVRERDGRWIAGVSTGIARRLDVDPVLVRVGFVLLALLGTVGIVLYLVCWALLPDEDGEILLDRGDDRSSIWGLILVTIAGALALGLFFSRRYADLTWVVLLAAIAFVFFRHARAGGSGTPSTRGTASVTAAAPGAAPGAAPVAAPTSAPILPGRPSRASWAPGPAVPPRTPRRPRRRSGGPAAFLLVSGLALTAYGLADGFTRANPGHGRPLVAGLAAATVMVGLSLVTLALLGRRAGGVSALVPPLLIALGLATAAPVGFVLHSGVGERAWMPGTATTRTAYELGVGSARLDLSRQPTRSIQAAQPAAPPVDITADVSVGELRIDIPPDTTVKIEATVLVGTLCERERPTCPLQGRDIRETLVYGEGTPSVTVHATVGIGALNIHRSE